MSKKYDVICMGSSTIDLFVDINRKFNKCSAGSKILIENLDYETGGGGTNSAVALKRLGCKSAFLGKVGGDHNGVKILYELNNEKVDIIPVRRSRLRTSFSVVMDSSKETDRIIYTYKGASNDLSIDDFDLKKVKAKWLYVATHLGKAFETCKKVIKYAKENDIQVLFNPSEYLAKHPKKISPILKQTDLLVLNKHEAQLLTKSKNQFKILAKKLLDMGPSEVIITDGKDGVFYSNNIENIRLEAKKVKVVSTAGAGDAFTSGFLAAKIHNKDTRQALKVGIKNAASVIRHIGTKNKLLTWSEITK